MARSQDAHERCEALVMTTGFFAGTRCENVGRYERKAREDTRAEVKEVTVRVCGTHAAVLDRGSSLSINTEGYRYGRPVSGTQTEKYARRAAVEKAEEALKQAIGYRNHAAASVGRVMVRYLSVIEPLLANVTNREALEDMRSILDRYHAAVREVEEAEAASQAAIESMEELES